MRFPQVPAWVEEHLVAHYGWSPTTLGEDILYAWVEPARMVAFAADPAAAVEAAQ